MIQPQGILSFHNVIPLKNQLDTGILSMTENFDHYMVAVFNTDGGKKDTKKKCKNKKRTRELMIHFVFTCSLTQNYLRKIHPTYWVKLGPVYKERELP